MPGETLIERIQAELPVVGAVIAAGMLMTVVFLGFVWRLIALFIKSNQEARAAFLKTVTKLDASNGEIARECHQVHVASIAAIERSTTAVQGVERVVSESTRASGRLAETVTVLGREVAEMRGAKRAGLVALVWGAAVWGSLGYWGVAETALADQRSEVRGQRSAVAADGELEECEEFAGGFGGRVAASGEPVVDGVWVCGDAGGDGHACEFGGGEPAALALGVDSFDGVCDVDGWGGGHPCAPGEGSKAPAVLLGRAGGGSGGGFGDGGAGRLNRSGHHVILFRAIVRESAVVGLSDRQYGFQRPQQVGYVGLRVRHVDACVPAGGEGLVAFDGGDFALHDMLPIACRSGSRPAGRRNVRLDQSRPSLLGRGGGVGVRSATHCDDDHVILRDVAVATAFAEPSLESGGVSGWSAEFRERLTQRLGLRGHLAIVGGDVVFVCHFRAPYCISHDPAWAGRGFAAPVSYTSILTDA